MKRLLLILLMAQSGYAQEITYRFKIADIPIRFTFQGQQRDDILRFSDVNNQGVVIGNTYVGDGFLADVKAGRKHKGSGLVVDSTNKVLSVRCPGDTTDNDSTWLAAINNLNQIVGSCTDHAQTVGFVYSSGTFTLLRFPGADGTIAFGINDLGNVVGQYWGFAFGDALNRFHGFLWKDGLYTTIDAPDPNAMATSLLAINTAGQIIGSYFHHVGPDINGYDTEIPFLYDRGVFTVLAVPGAKLPFLCCAATTFPTDINNRGQVVGSTYTSEGKPAFFLYGDGRYLTIAGLPDNILDMNDVSTVHNASGWGLNDTSDIAGTYIERIPCATCGFNDGPGFTLAGHSFIATPKGRKP